MILFGYSKNTLMPLTDRHYVLCIIQCSAECKTSSFDRMIEKFLALSLIPESRAELVQCRRER